jgi:bifunctional DNase/RNase
MTQETAIEMYVGGLVLDPNTQSPVVVLKDESGAVVLPIWIGVAEATSIASAIKQVSMVRPLTHDLMYGVILEMGLKVQRIVITELKDQTYFAELVLSQGEKALVFDSRPSDAIALALRASAPIYVAQNVLEQAKVSMSPEGTPGGSEGTAPTGTGEEGQPEQGADPESSEKDFRQIDRSKWTEILDNLDPDDFKYKM